VDESCSVTSRTETSVCLFTLFIELRGMPERSWLRELDARTHDSELKQQVWKMLHDQQKSQHVALSTGMQLNKRYVLELPLGEGASATVWSAFDSRLESKVALKIFNRGRNGKAELDRALQEARDASVVRHENVVRIRDVAWCEETGLPYIDMELCADVVGGQWVYGQSMATTEPNDQAEVVRWLIQAARGVQAAHEREVFHCDLKPHNIMIHPGRSAVVTDFGLAVRGESMSADALPAGALTSDALSRAGAEQTQAAQGSGAGIGGAQRLGGTPAYMAPEQVARLSLGRSLAQPDHEQLVRADVYALGAVLYHMLSARPPYRARPDALDPVADVLDQVLLGGPPPLRARSYWSGPSCVPQRLDRIVRKAMAREPSRRYVSAGALADDLRCYLERRPTSLEQNRHFALASLWLGSHWKTAFAALAVLAMLAGIERLLQKVDRIEERVAAAPPAGERSAPVAPTAQPEPIRVGTQQERRRSRRSAQVAAAEPTSRRSDVIRQRRSDAGQGLRPSAALAQPVSRQLPRVRTRDRLPAIHEDPARAPDDALASEVVTHIAHPRAAATSAIRALPNKTEDAEAAHAFLREASRDPTRLARVDFKSARQREYCLLNGKGDKARQCLSAPLLSAELQAALGKLHKRSGIEHVWSVDDRLKSIRACRTLTPPGSNIRRLVCGVLDLRNLQPNPPPAPPSAAPARVEVARVSPARHPGGSSESSLATAAMVGTVATAATAATAKEWEPDE
jgi:serine/threonine protein kinase